MFGRVTDILIIGLFLYIRHFWGYVSGAMYPDGLTNATTCEEFGKAARFNPYSVLDKEWFVFYYWVPTVTLITMKFEYPPPKAKAFLHYALDECVTVPINWTARFIVMTNLRTNSSSLLVETGDRGQFLKYHIVQCKKKGPRITPIEVRFKQFDGGKYIAYMECERGAVFLMAQREDIPPKNQLHDVAARAGYRCRGGKSYLYQGHEWMPIPEESEEDFWSEKKAEKEKETLDFMKREAERRLREKRKEKKKVA